MTHKRLYFPSNTEKHQTLVVHVGGAGVHVQPDRRNRRSDDAPGLRHRRLGGEPGAHQLPGIHEVKVVDAGLGTPNSTQCNSTSTLLRHFIGVRKPQGIM